MAVPAVSQEPLQEVLCALLGSSGELIKLTGAAVVAGESAELVFVANFAEGSEIPGQVSGVGSPTRNALRLYLALAAEAQCLRSFTEESRRSSSKTHSPWYQGALALAIEVVLRSFTETVIELLESVECGSINFRGVNEALEQYVNSFPRLSTLARAVKTQELVGGQIIRQLHEAKKAATPDYSEICKGCLAFCYRVLSQQIQAWVLDGQLHDSPRGEFFISGPRASLATAWSIQEWSDFSINKAMVPPFITPAAAESILFAGKVVQLFQKSALRRTEELPPGRSEPQHRTESSLSALREEMEKSLAFKSCLDDIQEDEIAFELAATAIRRIAAKHLWQFLVKLASMFDYLDAVCDFYLLRQGAFAQEYLEPLLGLRTASTLSLASEDAKVRETLSQAASKMEHIDSRMLSHFQIKMKAGARLDTPSVQRAALQRAMQGSYLSTPPSTLPAFQSATHNPLAVGATTKTSVAGRLTFSGELPHTPVATASATPQLLPNPPTPQPLPTPSTPQLLASPGLSSPWTPLVIEPRLEMSLQLLLTPDAVKRFNACYACLLEVKGTLFLVERACYAVRKAAGKHQWGARRGTKEVDVQWSQGMAELKSWEHVTGLVTTFLSQLQAYCTMDVVSARWSEFMAEAKRHQDFDQVVELQNQLLLLLHKELMLDKQSQAHMSKAFSGFRTMARQAETRAAAIVTGLPAPPPGPMPDAKQCLSTVTQQLGIILALVRKLCLRKLELRINFTGSAGCISKSLQGRAQQPSTAARPANVP